MGHRELSRDQFAIWSRVVLYAVILSVSDNYRSSLRIGTHTERKTPIRCALPGSVERPLCGRCLIAVSSWPLSGLDQPDDAHSWACSNPLIGYD